jgi:hypothetical protein
LIRAVPYSPSREEYEGEWFELFDIQMVI